MDNATKIASMVMGLGGLLISFLAWLSGQRNKRLEVETASERAERETREARAARELSAQEAERKRLGDEVWLIVRDLRVQVADVRSGELVLRERIVALERQVDTQDETIARLRDENSEVRGDLGQAKLAMAALTLQNGTQARELTDLRDENQTLKARVAQLEAPRGGRVP